MKKVILFILALCLLVWSIRDSNHTVNKLCHESAKFGYLMAQSGRSGKEMHEIMATVLNDKKWGNH